MIDFNELGKDWCDKSHYIYVRDSKDINVNMYFLTISIPFALFVILEPRLRNNMDQMNRAYTVSVAAYLLTLVQSLTMCDFEIYHQVFDVTFFKVFGIQANK